MSVHVKAPERIGQSDRSWRLATILSNLINPFIFPPLLFGLLAWHWGLPGSVAWPVLGLVFMHFTLLPLLYLVYLLHRNRIESLDVRRRLARTVPFMVGIASYSVVLMVLVFWQPTGWQPMAWLIGVYIVNTAVTILINLSWKISVHLMGLSGALGAFVFFLHHPLPGYAHRLAWDSIYWGLFVLVPLLMWARVTVRAHTWAQTLGGAAYGFGATYGLLSWGWECYAG